MDTRGESRGGLLRREVDFGPSLAAISRRRIEVILGLGVLFRVVQYLANRPYWMDEGSLAANITRESPRRRARRPLPHAARPPGLPRRGVGRVPDAGAQPVRVAIIPAPLRDRLALPLPRRGPPRPQAPRRLDRRRALRGLGRPDLLRLGAEAVFDRCRGGPRVHPHGDGDVCTTRDARPGRRPGGGRCRDRLVLASFGVRPRGRRDRPAGLRGGGEGMERGS